MCLLYRNVKRSCIHESFRTTSRQASDFLFKLCPVGPGALMGFAVVMATRDGLPVRCIDSMCELLSRHWLEGIANQCPRQHPLW